MGKVVDMTIALFVRRIAPHIDPAGVRGVTLVPELEPETVAFMKELPDRLLAGKMAFAVMRSRGVPEVMMDPGEHLRRVALPPARPERFEAFRVGRDSLPPTASPWTVDCYPPSLPKGWLG